MMIIWKSGKKIYSWIIGSIWLSYLFGFWDRGHTTITPFVDARPVTSFQLATGEWDISMRGSYWMNPSFVFPSVADLHASPATRPNPGEKQRSIALVKRRPWGSSLDCTLSLASDGTFVLTPKQTTSTDEGQRSVSTEAEADKTITNSRPNLFARRKKQAGTIQSRLLHVRGTWRVLPNPYCVTDRFYDEVSLTAYPRQKVAALGGEETNIDAEEGVLRTVQLTMNCRIWGRHMHNRQREAGGTKPYRMTHGTLVCNDVYTGDNHTRWWRAFFRPVLASFSAVRCSDDPKHEGWIDKERYGY